MNERAADFRETIAEAHGEARRQQRLDRDRRLSLYTNDDIATVNQRMADIFAANPEIEVFILVGRVAQFGPEAFAASSARSRITSTAKV
jgi:ribose transport system substrate-binding protein